MKKKDPKVVIYKPIKRPQKLTNVAGVLHGLLEGANNPLSDQFLRWKLWMRWSSFVGESIAAQSMPVGYNRGTLYVWVKHPVWMQQLGFIKDGIIENINRKLGRNFVTSIRFTMDKKDVPNLEESQYQSLINKVSSKPDDKK